MILTFLLEGKVLAPSGHDNICVHVCVRMLFQIVLSVYLCIPVCRVRTTCAAGALSSFLPHLHIAQYINFIYVYLLLS